MDKNFSMKLMTMMKLLFYNRPLINKFWKTLQYYKFYRSKKHNANKRSRAHPARKKGAIVKHPKRPAPIPEPLQKSGAPLQSRGAQIQYALQRKGQGRQILSHPAEKRYGARSRERVQDADKEGAGSQPQPVTVANDAGEKEESA